MVHTAVLVRKVNILENVIVQNSINIPNGIIDGKMNYFLTVLLLLAWGNVLIDNIRSTGYRDHVIAALTRLSLQQYVPIGGMSRTPGSLFHTCFVFYDIACYISHKFEKLLLNRP